jgi:hypothetical protein
MIRTNIGRVVRYELARQQVTINSKKLVGRLVPIELAGLFETSGDHTGTLHGVG